MNGLTQAMTLSGKDDQLTWYLMVLQSSKELTRLRQGDHWIHFSVKPQRGSSYVLDKLYGRVLAKSHRVIRRPLFKMYLHSPKGDGSLSHQAEPIRHAHTNHRCLES